eukprot:1542383-Rhodomonas_salina.1
MATMVLESFIPARCCTHGNEAKGHRRNTRRDTRCKGTRTEGARKQNTQRTRWNRAGQGRTGCGVRSSASQRKTQAQDAGEKEGKE